MSAKQGNLVVSSGQLQSPEQNGARTTTNGALVLGGRVKELLISDMMGSEVIEIRVGLKGEEKLFTVHKKLLGETGGLFLDLVHSELQPGQKVVLNTEDPAVFKLFIEILYSRRVPEVSAARSPADYARLKYLCGLYAMVDKFNLKQALRNLVMDKIQDGFLRLGCFPEPALVVAIYEHTRPESKLRKFCAASLVFNLRSLAYVENGGLKALLKHEDAVMDDFLEAVRKFSDNQDPRARHCHGEPGGCVLCLEGVGHGNEDGIFSCYFHIHDQEQEKVEPKNDANGISIENADPFPDQGCYFWRNVVLKDSQKSQA